MEAIRYLTYRQIDKDKWNACIDTAPNGSIYGYSNYLDQMAKHWDALVLGDYACVMPLTWNKKYNIHYLYQPPFTASLGVFGNRIDKSIVHQFLDAIPAKFKYWDFSLNRENFFPVEGYEFRERTNYLLSLKESYATISSEYRENVKRNIRKSVVFKDHLKKDVSIDDVIALANDQLKNITDLKQEDFDHFKKLYKAFHKKDKAVTYGVYAASGQLTASAAFFFSHDRAYYLLVGNHPNSKVTGASHALIDAFIKDHAGQDLTLDFEGSDLRNLAFFYSSFGARRESYPAIRLNRLPRLLKWMKK
ncbi:MAG TPA: GNAT family N-acetyltransferase [Ferruginibacter sp.]|nr:GNAT family N-acetyltransferase [Ferruginibacter sp.]